MTLFLIASGLYSLSKLPIDAVPDITQNQVQIITSSPSFGAEDIERQISFPIEQAVANIPNIEDVRSLSRFGLSVVTVVFKDNVDVYWARQQVSERLMDVQKNIPETMGKPELAPITTGLGEIYQYVIHPKKGFESKWTPMELRTLQDWTVRRQLLGVPGVADVSSFGGLLKQYVVELRQDDLSRNALQSDDILKALQKNNQNTGGAYLDKGPMTHFIRSLGLMTHLDDIRKTVVQVKESGQVILLEQVANVSYSSATRYGAMTRNDDGEVVGAIVMMLKGANSAEVIQNVKLKMEQIQKSLPEGVEVEAFLDRSELINRSIKTVTTNLIEGALIVIFVLVLLLGNWRAGLIVATVIPLAMLFAISMMLLFGVSGNLMSLGAIDFGLIVDGAVIVVEATLHHLKKRLQEIPNMTQAQAEESVLQSSVQMMGAASFGQWIILIVYLPLLALVGIEGKMFKPMAQTVAFALLGAWILSLTYVPMMSALLLNHKTQFKGHFSDVFMLHIQRLYKRCLRIVLHFRKAFLMGVLALFLWSVFVFKSLGSEFIPTLEEGDFAVETRVLGGSHLSQTIEASSVAGQVLLKNFSEVKQVVGKIGSGEIPTDPMPIEACDLMVILKPKKEWTSASSREELAQKMQEKLKEEIPGVTFGFQQPIQMRFNELMTGARQDVVIKVYGEDLEKLRTYVQKIGQIVQKIEGAEDVFVEKLSGAPQIVVEFDRTKMTQYGLNIDQVNTTINTAFAGAHAGFVFEGEKRFDLVLRLNQKNRESIEDVQGLLIQTPQGFEIPLSQIANVSFKQSPVQIQRDNTQRRMSVGFNVRSRDVQSIVREIKQELNQNLKLEPGYHLVFGGTFENFEKANNRLQVAVPAALFLIFCLLYLHFKSIGQTGVIFSAIPFAAIGGVFALWLRNMPFSISAGVGFIALFGIAVLNGIVLISEFNRLKNKGISDLNEILYMGTSTRLRPVLLTACVAALGFLPMAFSSGSGAEVQKPLATVVIGGLISSTILTLFILPLLYKYLNLWTSKRANKLNHSLSVLNGFMVLCLGFVGWLAPSYTMAQEQRLSVEEVIQKAQNAHPERLRVELQIEQRKAENLQMSSPSKTLLQSDFGIFEVGRENKGVDFLVAQTLPFPISFYEKWRLEQKEQALSDLEKTQVQSEIKFLIQKLYLDLQLLDTLVHLDSMKYENFKKLKNSVQRQIIQGDVSQKEMQAIDNELSLLQKEWSSNQNELNTLWSELVLWTEMDANNDIRAQGLKYKLTPLILKALSYKIETKQSDDFLENSIKIKVLKSQKEYFEQKYRLAKSEYFPEITLGYANKSADNFELNKGRYHQVQLGMSLAIFSGQVQGAVSQVNLEKKQIEFALRKAQIQLKSQRELAIQEIHRLALLIEEFKTNGLIQNKAQEILKSEWNKGEISLNEYTNRFKMIVQNQKNHLYNVAQYNQNILILEYLKP